MHWQSKSPLRERDHRIALMPIARPDYERGSFTIALSLVAIVLGAAWAIAKVM